VVILLECHIEPDDVLDCLNRGAGAVFYHADADSRHGIPSGTIRIFTRFSPDILPSLLDGPRFTIRHLQIPGQIEVIVAAVHFTSKLYSRDDDQVFDCTVLARRIQEAENQAGHDRTILIEDFNMNPFEPGVVGAAGLNATMVLRQARKGSRTVQGQDYRFFYNPIWGHFGGDGGTSGDILSGFQSTGQLLLEHV
jgi:hypothetical protein